MTKLQAVKEWLDNCGEHYEGDKFVPYKRPDGLIVVTKDNGNYDNGWPVYLYKGAHGVARVSAGCRDFSIEAAYAHWRAVRIGEQQRRGDAEREQRATNMVKTVLPRAERLAGSRGWRVA